MMVRCDLCPKRHRVGSRAFRMHLGGRDPEDFAEPTRTEMKAVQR